MSSSNEEIETQVPAIVLMGENVTLTDTGNTHRFITMGTLEDIDDNEAFISDLMAIHPNDENMVVEDLEEVLIENEEPPVVNFESPFEIADEVEENGVRISKLNN